MEMARKHFGLSYLEELSIVKKRENLCKKSRQEFLKFKQETANVQTNLNKPVFEDAQPDQSHQLEPYSWERRWGPPLPLENTNLPVERDSFKSLETVTLFPDVTVMEHQTQHLKSKQKKLHKEDPKLDSHLDEDKTRPVAIASLVGTTKQVSMLKKPERLPKPKYRKFVCAKPMSEKPFSLQHKVYDTEKPEQKIYSQHKIMENVKTGSVILETNYSITVDSSSSTKSPRIPKTISKPSTQFSVVELERTISKKISKIPSTKSFSRFSHEYRGPRKSKIYDKFIPQNKIQIQDSDEKFPPGVVPRSIDEIIASLQSTAPTLSDLRIKELLESVLGHDYNIKIEPQVIERERKPSLMEMPFEEATTVQMEQLEVESWIEDRSSPAEQATPADSEQTQLDTPQHLRLSSISPATEKGYIKVEKDTPKARAQETSSVLLPQMIPSFQESEEGMLSSEGIQLYESASLVPEVLEKVKSEEQEEFLFDSISSCTLEIRGKTFPQTKPVEIQESLEEIPQQQPLSLLSTWTTKIKDVDHPLIHHLCTASLRCALPTDMQLVSRVSHTSDKIGHDASLPAINPGYYESEDIFPTITCLEKQREINRILNEGVPVSEAYQCSQKEKNTVLPLHSPETMTEWQKKAEYCIEKPQLKLLGEQVKLHPGTLKMFWTPAPIKFSTPLSVMKQTLFSKYESNLINGVIYEDFSCDLHEEEEVESEDDFDYLLSTISIDRRRYSCPEFPVSTTFELCLSRRSASEPKLLLDRDKSAFKIAADFKATMQELMSAKQEASSTTAKITSPPAIQFSKDTPDVYSASKIGQTENIPPKQEVNKAILAEESRKAGMKYIVFPKRKGTKKSGKHLSPVLLQSVYVELQNAPRILKRSTSLGKLYTHNKYTIKVPQSVKCYRHPSLPHLLDFHTFAENRGGISEYRSDYAWVKEIWNKWFDEVYPSSSEHAEVKAQLVKKTAKEKPKEKEKELTDSAPIAEDVTSQLDGFQSEVDRLTHQIEEGCALAFNYCRRGAVYRKTGKLKAAMDDLEKAISLEPMLLNAYWHRHLLFLYQNKTRQAMEDLNFIIKCNKSHADAYLSRAEIFKKQGDNSLAIINYTLAMRCRPTDDEIYFKRAVLHEEEGDLLLAIEDYSKCINYNPRRTDALMKHGVYCFQKLNWLVAINDFTDVIEIDPNNADARTYRGRAYLKYEEFKKAAADFSAAIHLNPRNWLAFYYRGCILRKVDPKQALQDFSVSVLLNHDYENLSSFIHRGILYSEMKQWALAVCDFENAVALDRSLTLPYINIGLIMLLHLDHYLEAIELFTRAIRVNPLDTRPYLCRAQAYQKMQQLKDSLKDITRAIHLQPDSPHFCLIRGKYLLEMGNYKLASFCIHQVAEMEKGSVEYSLVQEALVQSFCQNHSKAIECAQIATKRQPEPSTFVLLGKIQMKAKKHKDAVASFKQALKLLMGTGKAVPCTFEAAEMYYFIGQCYMEQVSLIEACDAFSAAVRMYPRYTDAFYERGLCRMQLQQDKCLRDFNKVLAISPKHFQAYLSRAAFYGSKGRYSKAIMNCTEAINIHPNSVRAYLYRGALKIYNKTFKNAIEDLTKTIQLDNMCFLAYYNRGIGYHQIKDYKNALKDYSIVLLLEPNKDIVLKVLINRALIYVDLDQYAYSLEDFIEASLSKPKDTKLFQALAICYHRLQQYEKAVKTFSTVLKLDPFSLDGYIGRGNSYMEYGHDAGSKQAQKDFLKAIHLNPLCIKAKLCLGYNLQSLGKFQKAWHQFSAVIHIDPECHTAYDGRAIVCLQMGDTFAAFQDINVALKITTTAELLTNRGVINQFMGYLSCAMKDYQQAISVDPNYALAYFNAANMYFLNRQFSQANNYYSKSLTLDAKNESAFLNRAITNTLLKNFEEAKADFEKAINLSPFSAAIYYNKANLYNTLQQYEQAEEDISKALSIQPYDPLMYKLRADIRGKLGFIKEAIADYKKAIDIQELIFKG